MLYIACLCLSYLHKYLRCQNHTSNSAVLFGTLSSAILSICPAHGSLLLIRLSLSSFCGTLVFLFAYWRDGHDVTYYKNVARWHLAHPLDGYLLYIYIYPTSCLFVLWYLFSHTGEMDMTSHSIRTPLGGILLTHETESFSYIYTRQAVCFDFIGRR